MHGGQSLCWWFWNLSAISLTLLPPSRAVCVPCPWTWAGPRDCLNPQNVAEVTTLITEARLRKAVQTYLTLLCFTDSVFFFYHFKACGSSVSSKSISSIFPTASAHFASLSYSGNSCNILNSPPTKWLCLVEGSDDVWHSLAIKNFSIKVCTGVTITWNYM